MWLTPFQLSQSFLGTTYGSIDVEHFIINMPEQRPWRV
jgi:hypothetical protein